MSGPHTTRPRGLAAESLAALIERDPDWQAIRDCHERSANAARTAAYRDRLALSRDPWATEDAVARRQIVGLRVQTALRKRERIKHLRQRIGAVPTPAPLPANVVRLPRRSA